MRESCYTTICSIFLIVHRLREERGEAERVLALDHKARDLSSHNGSPNGHSPVLNLSKSGGGCGSGAEHSGSEAGAHTGPEDEDDEDNVSDVDEEDEKEQGNAWCLSGSIDQAYYIRCAELSDTADVNTSVAGSEGRGGGSAPSLSHQQAAVALNYSTLVGAAAAAAAQGGVVDPSGAISSTETLLRNIQGLLKVAADNARQQERQINYEKAELKMDILREREMKESLERQLMDEQKIRVLYQKRLKKERKARRRLQDQLELEMKRRSQYEEALKNTSAGDALRLINESGGAGTPGEPSSGSGGPQVSAPSESPAATFAAATVVAAPTAPPPRPPPPHVDPSNEKQWNYSGLDLMGSGAAFWQNYSGKISRKSRQQAVQQQQQAAAQQQVERDVKSPLQDRAGYYKNSVLFTSAT
ncbi:hypothetical protein B566_EDAN010747 [Ephemera danica]|nr:hypothetical protein B566_EDAN010747 [Ephemera danica]